MQELVRQAMRRRRARRRLVADLRARVLREDAGADRAVARPRRRVRRHVHLAHAQRGRPPARSDRRADHDRARGRRAGRDLPPQGGGRATTGPRWTRPSRTSRRRAPRACASPPTCTPITAGATGLDATMPPWVQEGGYEAWAARLKDPAIRARASTRDDHADRRVGELLPRRRARTGMLLVGFKNDALKPLTGKTLAEVAALRGTSPEETAMDLVIEDGSRVDTVYFLMSRRERAQAARAAVGQLRLGRRLAWRRRAPSSSRTRIRAPTATSRGCSASTCATRSVVPLEEAIRRLTSLPAENLRLDERGRSRPGILRRCRGVRPGHDSRPRDVREAAPVLDRRVARVRQRRAGATDGEHTGATPGRVVRGPGYTP